MANGKTLSNVEQLRAAIDRGETGDKVAGFDPAAAPLGSDDEAAGTPVTPAHIALQEPERLKIRIMEKWGKPLFRVLFILTVIFMLAAVLVLWDLKNG